MAEHRQNQPASPSDIGSIASGHSVEAAAGTPPRDSHFQATTEGQSTEQRTADAHEQAGSRNSTVSGSNIQRVVQGDERRTFYIENYNVYPAGETAGGIDRQVSESPRNRTESESQPPTSDVERQVSTGTRNRVQSEGQLPAGDFNWVTLSQKIKIDRNRPLCKHAEVYHAEQDMGGIPREVAVKLLKKTERSVGEARFLVRLESHSNIVKIIDHGDCSEGPIPHIFIAMELCHQNLDQYVKNHLFQLPKATSFFQQTVSAINHIHDNDIAHGDLKPSNILVTRDENSVKVSDFGVSKAIPGDQTKVTASNLGTEGFKAPESYETGTRTYGYKADIYPLGINGYFIFTHGKHPFGPYSFDWVHNIVHNKNCNLSLVPLFPEPRSHRRPQLIRLFKRMLECDPEDRPSARDVLNDAYFADSSHGINVGGAGAGDASNSQDATYRSIVEVLQNRQETLLPDIVNKLSTSLIAAQQKLQEDKRDEGVLLVRQAIPRLWNADEVNNFGKKLEDKHPVFSVLLHRVAAQIFNAQENTTPEDTVDWISERVADIRCATEQIMDSESTGDSRYIAINICPEFMDELLQGLRAVEHVKGDARTLAEVSCIISITRINIDAGKYPDVAPKENIITMCQEGLACLENEFGDNVNKFKYYGYLLNNIGEAYVQLCRFEDAENYFQKALAVKKDATYRSREAKQSDVQMTKSNLRECTLRRNSESDPN